VRHTCGGNACSLLVLLALACPVAAAFQLPPAVSLTGALSSQFSSQRAFSTSNAISATPSSAPKGFRRNFSVRALRCSAEMGAGVQGAFVSGLKKMGEKAAMDAALSDLVLRTSDAYAAGVTYKALVDSLPSSELDTEAITLRERLLALIYLACEGCNYPRKGGSPPDTPSEYSKVYSTFIRNLVVLRKSGVGYAQLVAEISKSDLSEVEAKSQKKGTVPTLNGVQIPDGLADVAMLVLLTFDIVISKGPK
jgi:hypothetical protein